VLAFENEVAELFRDIRKQDPKGIIDQLLSLPAANQYRGLYTLTARYVPTGSTVLDWGCGRGHFSWYLANHGYPVTAYSLEDPPEIFGALNEAGRGRVTFVRGGSGDPQALPFPSRSFDAVFSVGVLEHVRELGGDERASLNELRRVLVPGGVLIAYHFPNRFSYIEALSRAIHGRRYHAIKESVKFHKHLFSTSDITRLVRESGFSLVDMRRYGFLPRNSFNRLPPSFRSSQSIATIVNMADVVLERAFAPLAQNFYFVARSP
jgi:ubiquinone/menaquinone biosynthesis C-methylase UbiE